jgi:hypothetical protein
LWGHVDIGFLHEAGEEPEKFFAGYFDGFEWQGGRLALHASF